MLRVMSTTMKVHPKSSRPIILSKDEIIGVDKQRVDGKEVTLFAIGDLPYLVRLDLNEVLQVEKNSKIRS